MFKRNASGLVKALKIRDVFMYDSLTISLFSMMWFLLYIFQPVAFNGGSIVLGTALLALVSIPFFITYSYLSKRYPLAGGDYIFQSRTMHPAIGFVFTFTGWVIWQLFFIAWFGYYIVDVLLIPYFYYTANLTNSWVLYKLYSIMGSAYIVFIMTTVMLILAFFISLKGLRFYAKLQRFIFLLMVVAGASALAILFGHASFMNVNATLSSLRSINWMNTIGTWALSWGAIGYGMWSVLNNEEISGVENRKMYSIAMVGAVLLNVLYVIAVWIGLKATIGYSQMSNLSQLWYDGKLTGLLGQIGGPYYTALMVFLNPNPILYTLLIIGAVVSMFQVIIAIMIGSSRVVLAQSLDGILPLKLATVQDRSHSPIYSLLFDLAVSILWLALIVFIPQIGPFFVSVVFATQVTWILTMVSGMIIAFKDKNALLFFTSTVGFLLNALIAAFYIIYPQLGFMSTTSMIVVLGVFAIAYLYFVIRNFYLKKRTGFTIEDRIKQL